MSTVKSLREYAAHSARKIVYNQPGFGSADLRFLSGWAPSSAVFMEENMRNIFQKLKERAATSARRMYLGRLSAGLRLGKSSAAASRLACLAAISLSLTLAGCDTGGGGGGGDSSGDGGGGAPTCTGNQILKDGSCEACSDPQYPNADRTACVTNCPDGQIRLANNPACEIQVTCTGRQIFNPIEQQLL